MKRLLKKLHKSKNPQDSHPITGASEPATSIWTTASVPIIQTASATVAHGLGVSALATNDCAPVAKESEDPPLTIANTFGPSTESATSTSTIVANTVDLMPSVLPGPETTAHELGLSTPAIDNLALVAHPSPSLPGAITQANSGFAEWEQDRSVQHSNPSLFANTLVAGGTFVQQHSNSSLFGNNALITGGTIVKCDNYNVIIPPPNAGESILLLEKPNSSPFFTGRKDVFDKLEKIFVERTNNSPRRFCLLWGMGGIGKTQICLKFAEDMANRFSHVFWVDASSHESMTMCFKGISSLSAAQACGVVSSVESVRQWMSHIQEEWLIIFDNADDLSSEMVAKFIPSGNRGNILITSRNRSMGRVMSFENCIEINQMEERDAIDLLLKTSCLDALPEHQECAKEIVHELGCIPHAVDQAGAYIEAGNCDIDKYLTQFSLHRETLMSDVTFRGASGYNQTVYGTWDLSFKEIERRAGESSTKKAKAAQAAILILQICAFYHHNNISIEIFQSAAEESRKHIFDSDVAEKLPQAINSLDYTLLALDNDGHWDTFVFGEGIGLLLSFSLIKRGQSSKILSIHPLVHAWSRDKMSKVEQQRMCQAGSIVLSCAIPLRFRVQDYALQGLIFQHIKANELYARQIKLIEQYYDDKYSKFAFVMSENGDWNNAEQLLVQVFNMRKKLLGADHLETLRSMANLANIYDSQGRWNEAEQLQVQVMDMSKKLLGENHPEALSSITNLANTYYSQGRWNEAEQLQVQVMNMRKKLLGVEHPDTLRTMHNLANIYDSQGRWNEAEQLQVQVVNMNKKLLGAEHPNTLTSMQNIGNIYCSQGRWNEAEQLQVQVMDMSNKLLGAEHPNTLTSMHNLANIYHVQKRWNEAEQLQVQVMNMSKKLFGAEHPNTLSSMQNLGITYCSQRRWSEAEQLQVQVINMRKKLLGAEHPDTLRTMQNLAVIYNSQGRWNEAELLQVQVINMSKKLLDAEHPETLMSMQNLAAIYHSQGRWNEVEQLQVQIIDISKKLLGENHTNTLTMMQNLANTYYNQRRWNEAEQLQFQVIDMSKKLFGAEHPSTLKRMQNLVAIYYSQERWNEAEQLQSQVLDISKKLLGADHSIILWM